MAKPPQRKTKAKRKGSSSKKKKKNNGVSWKMRLLKYFFLLSAGVLILLFTLFGTVYMGLFGRLPDENDLRNIQNENASEVFSSDGKLLGKYFRKNRSSISFDAIPTHAINALIATEDSRFFEHEGIDFYSIPRVVIKTVILGDRSGGGGSTISQQLIKNLYGRKNHGALSMPVNKLKENITALKLEDVYTKEEIVALYLNTVSFGEDVYGIKSASQRYFNADPSKLSLPQAALLIGMLKATTSYNPRLHPEAAIERRNTVMALMVKEGSLAPEEFATLKQEPLQLDYTRQGDQFGPAPYLRAHLEPMINELISDKSNAEGAPYNLYRDGLKIEISINSKLQELAEESLKKTMARLQKSFDEHWKGKKPWNNDAFIWAEAKKSYRYKALKESGSTEEEIRAVFNKRQKLLRYTPRGMELAEMSPLDSVAYHQMVLQASFLAVEAKTGAVLAYCGGIDFTTFPYDHVQGRRQVGSTFKPFVYASAIASGYKPCDYIENEPIIFSNYDNWSPQNSNGKYGGFYSLKGGLANSVNTIAARLIAETGPKPVRELAIKAGINKDIPEVPAIALGVASASLFEMVSAYSIFSQDGMRHEPWFITRITDSAGNVIYEREEKKPKRVTSTEIAQSVRSMMELVVDSGTAKSIRSVYGYKSSIAAKTGTTQNNADGWFIAATPEIVCGAWVGGQSPIVRFRSTRLGQGAATALPIVGSWLDKTSKDKRVSNYLGGNFTPNSPEVELSLICPLYIESKGELLFDMLFQNSNNDLKKELKKQIREEEKENQDKKGGWMKRLIDKLKK